MKFPQSDLADNAQYWIGECFYSQKKFQEAKEGFAAVAEHFPFGNKVPDALYKEASVQGLWAKRRKGRPYLNSLWRIILTPKLQRRRRTFSRRSRRARPDARKAKKQGRWPENDR